MKKNNNLMSGKGEKGKWITVNGTHVFVGDDQSVEDAINKHFSKSSNSKDPKIEELSNNTGLSYKDAERMYKELQEEDKAYKDFLNNKTEEDRNDKYTIGNPDNINKSTTPDKISEGLKDYKGSGQVDFVMPGGKWAQIRPQKDGSYLVRSSNGSKYVATTDDAKNELINSFASSISPQKAEAFSKGEGHLSEDSGYQGVRHIDSAPKVEYKSSSPYQKGATFTNPAGVKFEVVDTSTSKHGVEYVKLKDADGEFEIEKEQLDRLGWLT